MSICCAGIRQLLESAGCLPRSGAGISGLHNAKQETSAFSGFFKRATWIAIASFEKRDNKFCEYQRLYGLQTHPWISPNPVFSLIVATVTPFLLPLTILTTVSNGILGLFVLGEVWGATKFPMNIPFSQIRSIPIDEKGRGIFFTQRNISCRILLKRLKC